MIQDHPALKTRMAKTDFSPPRYQIVICSTVGVWHCVQAKICQDLSHYVTMR